eukprot:scaffold58791_cov62-Phaeocystis_antarctica.AAC.4
MLYPHRSRSRRSALGCKLHLCLALPCESLMSLSEPVRSGWIDVKNRMRWECARMPMQGAGFGLLRRDGDGLGGWLGLD